MALYDLSEVSEPMVSLLWPIHRLIETRNALHLVKQ